MERDTRRRKWGVETDSSCECWRLYLFDCASQKSLFLCVSNCECVVDTSTAERKRKATFLLRTHRWTLSSPSTSLLPLLNALSAAPLEATASRGKKSSSSQTCISQSALPSSRLHRWPVSRTVKQTASSNRFCPLRPTAVSAWTGNKNATNIFVNPREVKLMLECDTRVAGIWGSKTQVRLVNV